MCLHRCVAGTYICAYIGVWDGTYICAYIGVWLVHIYVLT